MGAPARSRLEASARRAVRRAVADTIRRCGLYAVGDMRVSIQGWGTTSLKQVHLMFDGVDWVPVSTSLYPEFYWKRARGIARATRKVV